MTKLEELESAVSALSREEYERFRDWFLEQEWKDWDREIEADAEAGRLDLLVEEASDSVDN